MNTRITLFTCTVILCLTGCVKDPQDIPPAVLNNPVFFSNLQADNVTLSMTAGTDGYVMNTNHFTDGRGVTHYHSTLASNSCEQSHCPSLEIEFFDNQIDQHPEHGAEYTFQPGSKAYYNAEADNQVEVTFGLGQDGYEASTMYWTIGQDSTQVAENEMHMIAKPDEFVDLCFHRSGISGCDALATYCFHSLATSPFVGVLKADRTFGEYILIELELQGYEPYTYDWMNGSTTPFILVPAEDGTVDVTVNVTDSTGSWITVNQSIQIDQGNTEMCGGTPVFNSAVGKAPFEQFASVIVRYRDEEGNLYSTEYGPQTSSTFEIVDVDEFGKSPQGDQTKAVSLILQAILYSPDGTAHLTLSSDETVFAVSYSE